MVVVSLIAHPYCHNRPTHQNAFKREFEAVLAIPIITIGTSAGGIEALQQILPALPSDLPAAIFIVIHIAARSDGFLPQILGRTSTLPVSHAKDGERVEAGHIYLAPPDFHLLLSDGRIRLSAGPKVNSHRPAIDPLFFSAAAAFSKNAIGVILTGTLDDGTMGLWEIKNHGGIAVVQNPETALYADMPLSAVQHVAVDHIVKLEQMADVLSSLVDRMSNARAAKARSKG